jgi:hypothetical protein
VIGAILWIVALIGGAWALERWRRKHGELTGGRAKRGRP